MMVLSNDNPIQAHQNGAKKIFKKKKKGSDSIIER